WRAQPLLPAQRKAKAITLAGTPKLCRRRIFFNVRQSRNQVRPARQTNLDCSLGGRDHSAKGERYQMQTCCPIVELRQYTLHRGKRDVLIDLFDREFIEPQETLGMNILGQFSDLDDP